MAQCTLSTSGHSSLNDVHIRGRQHLPRQYTGQKTCIRGRQYNGQNVFIRGQQAEARRGRRLPPAPIQKHTTHLNDGDFENMALSGSSTHGGLWWYIDYGSCSSLPAIIRASPLGASPLGTSPLGASKARLQSSATPPQAGLSAPLLAAVLPNDSLLPRSQQDQSGS